MRVLVTLCLGFLLGCLPSSGGRTLKVCAAPDELPFSDRAEQGFENRIARLLADTLGYRLRYSWNGEPCDVTLRAEEDAEFAITRPYYRSSYVFLTRAQRQLYFRSLDDPRLLGLRFGVEEHSPGARALAAHGVARVKALPSASLISAVETDELDVGLVWGPRAGSLARGDQAPLRISIIDAGDDQAFSADVCLGVRRSLPALKDALEKALVDRREAIDSILREYGVPLTGL